MNVRTSSADALYCQLAEDLRGKIIGGVYPCGSKLPSESELMADTGFSRSTVRHALEILVDEGLVVKERGRGAFVSATLQSHADETVFSSFTTSMRDGHAEFETRLVDARMADAAPDIASFLNVDPASPVVELVRLRYLDHEPFCLETTWLPAEFQELLDTELDRRSLYAALRERFHRVPANGHKTFEVCFARPREAFLLDVERDTALMLVTDFVYDIDGGPLHVSKRVMRTDKTKYTEPIR